MKADAGRGRWPAVLLVLGSAAVLVLCAAVLVAHLNDPRELDHTSGVWFALAWHVNHGRVYPEVYDGSLYGGTRYMPLYFLAHAGLARGTGEYLMAGKALSLLVALACWALLFIALRQGGCPAPASIGLTARWPGSSATPLLSEDPFVPVARGQAPVLVDPYAFVRLASKQPRLAQELAQRIRAHEFRHVVLLRRLDDPRAEEDWYRVLLGPDVLKALRAAYRLQGQAEGYFVYVPRD
jgi:hypothetical protein